MSKRTPAQPPVEPTPAADPPPARALRIARQGARIKEQHDQWVRDRLETVADLVAEGYTQVDIADLLQVSKPRAGQLVEDARKAGLLLDREPPQRLAG